MLIPGFKNIYLAIKILKLLITHFLLYISPEKLFFGLGLKTIYLISSSNPKKAVKKSFFTYF